MGAGRYEVYCHGKIAALKISVLGIVLGVLAGCTSQPETVDAIEELQIVKPPDFSGSWEMDYRLSDQADEKIRWQYMEALAAEERARQPEDSRYRSAALDHLRAGNLSHGIVAIGRFTEEISRADVLTIRQDPERITIERADDYALTCEFSHAPVVDSPFGQEGCVWYGDQLIFDLKLPEGLNVRHTLSRGVDRVNLATSVYYDRIPFTLNRVYTPFVPGDEQYDCEFKVATLRTCTLGAPDQ